MLPTFAGASRDWQAWSDDAQRADITARAEIQPVSLSEEEVSDLVAFLHSLTDTSWQVRGLGVPDTVPSGLPLDQ